MLIVSAVLSPNKKKQNIFLNSINDTQLYYPRVTAVCGSIVHMLLSFHYSGMYIHITGDWLYFWHTQQMRLQSLLPSVSHHSTFLALDTIFPESLCFCLLLRASPSCLMLVSFVWFLFMPYNLLCLLFYFWTLDFLPQFLHNISNFLTCDVPLVAWAFLRTLIVKQPSLAYTAFPR